MIGLPFVKRKKKEKVTPTGPGDRMGFDEWAATGDTARLSAALDRFAARNRTSEMWKVFLI